MKCPSCGVEVAENLVICPTCGVRIERESDLGSQASGPPAAAPETAAATGRQPAAGAAPAGAAQPAGAGRPGEVDFPPPWRYSLKDMRIIWFNMILLTAVFVLFGIWLNGTRASWPGWLHWLTPTIVWGVLLIIPAVLWIYQLCKMIYRTTIRYDLDDSRLIHKEGIFVSQTNVIELFRIDDMGATQSLIERFLCGGIGTVRVHSEDPSDPVLVLRGLEHHESVFRQIDQKRAEARRRKAFVQA